MTGETAKVEIFQAKRASELQALINQWLEINISDKLNGKVEQIVPLENDTTYTVLIYYTLDAEEQKWTDRH